MTWTDENGNRLAAGNAGLVITGSGGAQAGFYAAPGELYEIYVAACRAAGREPPVVLGRPDLGGQRWYQDKGLRVERTPAGGMRYSIGGNAECLTLAASRRFAAAEAALADLPDDGHEACVEALAKAIEDAECVTGDIEGLARFLLANGAGRG